MANIAITVALFTFHFSLFTSYAMHDVAPKAVSIAEAIDAINCTMNFIVSFLLIIVNFKV